MTRVFWGVLAAEAGGQGEGRAPRGAPGRYRQAPLNFQNNTSTSAARALGARVAQGPAVRYVPYTGTASETLRSETWGTQQ